MRDDDMAQHLEIMVKLTSSFQIFEILQLIRQENNQLMPWPSLLQHKFIRLKVLHTRIPRVAKHTERDICSPLS